MWEKTIKFVALYTKIYNNTMSDSTIFEIDLFQIHYYLEGKSHSMDALTLNKVEAEFLKLSKEVSKIFDCKLIIESQALEEGGIKSTYRFLTKEKNLKYTLSVGVFLSTIIGNILTNVISDNLTEDKEQTELTKEYAKLKIDDLKSKQEHSKLISEKYNLEIKHLKQQIIKDSIEISEKIKNSQQEIEVDIDENELDKKILKTATSNKIKIYKSNFYQNLSKGDKVKKVSTQILNHQGIPISEERFVKRSEFKNHIFVEKPLEPLYLNSVELEIIAPVLKNNKMTWKALFNEKQISFSVDDKNFIDLIINKGLSFNNGTKLLCDLEIKKKLNKNGEVKEGRKTIYNVQQIKYPNGDIVDL